MKLLFCSRSELQADGWLADLRAALPECEVQAWQPGLPPEYDMALVWDPPQQLFDEQTALRVAFNLGAGVDHLLALDLPPQLQILRLQDAGMAVQMAEYVCHAVIRRYRQFDRYQHQQAQGLWNPRSLRSRSEFTVGVMGLGVLGSRVARAVRGFEFPVLGWSRSRHELEGVRCYAGEGEFDDFLRATRVLVCLLPLTDGTRGIVNSRTLSLLQHRGYLINVARGGLVVEDDLRKHLDSGHLAGAMLDVMQQEPLPPGHWMWSHPSVTVTPHISGMTLRRETIAQVVRAVEALRRGEQPAGHIDLVRGY